MKKITYGILILTALSTLFSCNAWLTELPAGTQTLEEYYVSGETCEPVVNGCYTPAAWDMGSTYFSEWFIGDVCSDDAVKGGQNISDNSMVLEMETFTVNSDNTVLLDYYRTQYIGIARCNRAIHDIAQVAADQYMDALTKARYIAEAKFLRAFYYFRLVRVFGKVPYYTFIIDGADKLTLSRAELSEIYGGIVKDLEEAEKFLWEKSEYAAADLGRATKGAARAMLLKVYLTGNRVFKEMGIDPYAEAVKWGEKIYQSREYDLCGNYFDNFTLAGENGIESVFEIQYTNDPTSDYGGLGFTRGTFTLILQRPREVEFLNGQEGWGYNRPTQDLVAEYEANDPRRDMTIRTLKEDEVANPEEGFYNGQIKTINLKYAMLTDGSGGGVYPISHHSRGPLNHKEIRYADVLLMYAEACLQKGDAVTAKTLLEAVRSRARHGDSSILPAFPGYNGYSDNNVDLMTAIRHERRVELAMEGKRWFDLCRWNNWSTGQDGAPVISTIMNAYVQSAEIQSLYGDIIAPFKKDKNEIFPIPEEERRLAGLDQNPGY